MTDQPDTSHLTYFDGTISVRAGVFRCRIHGQARARRIFVAVHVSGSSIEDSFRSSRPLEVDLLEWTDLDRALRLAGELAAR
jgi:hypothetical protein